MILKAVLFTFIVLSSSLLGAYLSDDFWGVLGNIGTILGIVSFVPIVYAVWEYIGYQRREEQERKLLHTQVGTQPIVLTVDIGGKTSIRNDVEAYLKKQPEFESFDFDRRVFVVHFDTKEIQPSHVDAIIAEVEAKLDEIRSKAADKIHLFLKVPLPIAVMIGSVLANRTPTMIYHYQHNKGYENWGMLHR